MVYICTGLLVGSMKGIVKSRRCFLATHDTLRDDKGSFFFTISSVRHGCRPHTNADAHAHTLAHMLAETLLWYHQQTTVVSKLGKYAKVYSGGLYLLLLIDKDSSIVI